MVKFSGNPTWHGKSRRFSRSPLGPGDFHGFPRDSYGFPRDFMDFRGISMDFPHVPRQFDTLRPSQCSAAGFSDLLGPLQRLPGPPVPWPWCFHLEIGNLTRSNQHKNIQKLGGLTHSELDERPRPTIVTIYSNQPNFGISAAISSSSHN